MNLDKAKEILGDTFSFLAEDTNQVVKELKLPKTAKVLDVGTGMGFMAILLALNGYKVITGEPEHDTSIYAKQDWFVNSEKVNVDHLIQFKPFDAKDMPFEDNTFDAVFFLGSFHHIDKKHRVNVMQECTRTTKSDAVICFFEPNQKTIKIARETDPSHPDAADPNEYIQGLNLVSQKMEGNFLDVSIFQKQ